MTIEWGRLNRIRTHLTETHGRKLVQRIDGEKSMRMHCIEDAEYMLQWRVLMCACLVLCMCGV